MAIVEPPEINQQSAAIAAGSTPWHGQLAITYRHQAGQTQVAQVATRSPLRLQRPFYPEGPAICHSVMIHTAGGMVGGDRLDYTCHLQPHAQVLLTTAAAHKVYRSTGAVTHQHTQIHLAPDSWLEWLPQETILFREAQYQQQLRVELAPGAHWLGWDLTRLGRTARGEVFDAGIWRSQLEVWQGDLPLWLDRQQFAGSPARLQSYHGLGGQAVVGTLVFLGSSVSGELVEQVRQLGTTLLTAAGIPQWGASRLTTGLICRYRGPSSQAARHWFQAVWQVLRQTYRGRSACPPRVW